MDNVLVVFDDVVEGPGGVGYQPRASGRPCADGRWEGWLEFVPVRGDAQPLCTGRETMQPSRADVEYWAAGLTRIFLEGAMGRARARAEGADEGPVERPLAPVIAPRAVLNPFEVYAQGEDVLRQELRALSPMHLRNVLRAYSLTDQSADEVARLDARTLAAQILDGVRARVSGAAGDRHADLPAG